MSFFYFVALKGMQEYKKLQNPERVAEAIIHALLAKHPKLHYIVGFDANTFYRMMTWLPDWIGDHILGWPEPYGEPFEELK